MLKIVLFVLNLLFLVFGVEIVWIGATIHLNLYPLSLLVEKLISEVPAVLIILGVVIFFMALLGIGSIWKENVLVIKVFLILMILVFLVEISVEVSTYILRSQIYNNLSHDIEQSFEDYDEISTLKVLDQLQIKFHCCGANNYTDWFKTAFGQSTWSVPSSCCINIMESCGRSVSNQTINIHSVGCAEILSTWIEEYFSIIRGTSVCFAFGQVVGIFLSSLYIKKLQDNYIPYY
ncbi:CD63 antigen-like [Hemitrygon akajei]|uniref:CD63 antigen-like n=1 Tax=Hemitrygon akajei TaxID=2704970 RepID=UPI003BF9EBFC